MVFERQLVREYPNTREALDACPRLIVEVAEFGEREKLYQEIRAWDPGNPFPPMAMAEMYLKATKIGRSKSSRTIRKSF
jgi:hypothetical protein